MRKKKYDIFISYRREGGKQYARTLQLMLEKKGYHVFLDYDELIDGKFSPKIEAAIKEAPIYVILLTKGALDKCVDKDNWVRQEIEIAIREQKRIIPVNPDNTFDGVPEVVPPEIKEVIEGIQHSEINFGQPLNATVDLMVKNRIKPYIPRRNKRIWYAISAVFVTVLIGIIGWLCIVAYYEELEIKELQKLKDSVTFNGKNVDWAPDVTQEQLNAIDEIFKSMVPIDGGEFLQGALPLSDGSYDDNVEELVETPALKKEVESFFIGKYEITVGQWNAIMGDNRDGDPALPIAYVTFEQAKDFANKLSDLTLLSFRLPSESEWEYVAKGSNTPEGFMYAGSNNADDVAWWKSNSRNAPHAELRATPTVNDIFNMSGNVSEWCDTKFQPNDEKFFYPDNGAVVVRGGNYNSELYEITVYHREPMAPDTSIPTLGFRVALNKTL